MTTTTQDAVRTGGPAMSPGSEALAMAREMGPGVGALLVLSVTLPGILGTVLLFGSVAGAETAAQWAETAGWIAPYAVATAFAIATGSAVLPTYALSFACGVVFGPFVGGAVAMFGVTAGSVVGYGWGALLARRRVMRVIDVHPRAAVVRSALLDRPLWTETMVVGLLRFPPNSPFALTNLAMSATSVRWLPYVVGTAVGIAPRTLFAVWLGSSVGDLAEAKTAGGGWRIAIGAAVGIVVFVLVYRLFSKWARAALAAYAAEDRPGDAPAVAATAPGAAGKAGEPPAST